MARTSASERRKAREERKNRFKGLFGGRKTRMYLGNPYPADMLKYNKRGTPIGVKMTTDSQGPNPRPTITEDTSSSGGGKTTPVSTSTNNNSKTNNSKTNNTSKKTTETKPLKAKTFKEFMAEKGGGQKFEVPDLVSKSKPVGTTKAERRRENRENRRAIRRARKSGEKYGTAQFDANVKAEKDLIRKRRAGRRQFLRNFASQLTTGENAPAQARNFEGRKKDFFNSQSTAANEGDKAEIEQNTNQFTDLLNTTSNDNFNFNKFLIPSTQPDPSNFLGTSNIKDFYKPGEFAVSPTLGTSALNKVEEDLTPISAMRKEYNKKRGL